MLFSERIRTLRKEQGVLQRRLAEAIGVDVPMYSRYEHGERHPKREQVVKLARLLGTDAGELVALWLAEEAMNAIGHDKMSGRASQLLLQQLSGNVSSTPEAAPTPPSPSDTEKELIAQNAQLENRNQELSARNAQLASRNSELVTRNSELETRNTELESRNSEPETLNSELTIDPTLLKAPEADAASRTVVASMGHNPMPYYIKGDARQVMATIEDQSIDCIVTTPPYWNLKKYNTESIQAKTMDQYCDELLRVMAEAWRVLKPQGSLWLNLADVYADRALQALPWRIAMHMIDLQGWTLRNDVVWNKPLGEYGSSLDHLRNVHEFMFHFVKNPDDFYFAEAELRRYAKQIGEKANVMPGDVWSIEPEKSAIERYRVSPEPLCLLPIVATCPRDGIVLDPYCGTGTTCKVAYDVNRRSIGIDINDDRLQRARGRVEQKSLSLF